MTANLLDQSGPQGFRGLPCGYATGTAARPCRRGGRWPPGHRKAAQRAWLRYPGVGVASSRRCVPRRLRRPTGWGHLGDPCISEEIKEWDQDTTGRNRFGSGTTQAAEGDLEMTSERFEIVRGSGNVFRDFGDADADLEQLRAGLAARIIRVLDERKLTVRKAGEITGIAAADFSRIRRAKLGRFTIDRLMTILARLDQRVEVTLTFRARHRARRSGAAVHV